MRHFSHRRSLVLAIWQFPPEIASLNAISHRGVSLHELDEVVVTWRSTGHISPPGWNGNAFSAPRLSGLSASQFQSAATMSGEPVFGTAFEAKEAEAGNVATSVVSKTGTGSTESLRLGESEGGVYAVGGALASYEPIERYEGKHRYDPKYEWTEGEEKRLIRRVRPPSYLDRPYNMLGCQPRSSHFPCKPIYSRS
jgi:hypothetical protein